MTQTPPISAKPVPHSFGAGYLFGIPLRDLGWFGTLLIALASGFLAFFASTFVAIVSILIYNSAARAHVDFAYSYTRVGLPLGLLVMAFAFVYLGRLWMKRMFTRG